MITWRARRKEASREVPRITDVLYFLSLLMLATSLTLAAFVLTSLRDQKESNAAKVTLFRVTWGNSQRETMWFQKSRSNWIIDRDRNTRFFHLSTVIKTRGNKILALRSPDGCWIDNMDVLKTHFNDHFKNFFALMLTIRPCAAIGGGVMVLVMRPMLIWLLFLMWRSFFFFFRFC